MLARARAEQQDVQEVRISVIERRGGLDASVLSRERGAVKKRRSHGSAAGGTSVLFFGGKVVNL